MAKSMVQKIREVMSDFYLLYHNFKSKSKFVVKVIT